MSDLVAADVPRTRRRTAASLAFVVLVTCLVTGLFMPVARASCAGPQLALGVDGASPSAPSYENETMVPTPVGAGDRVTVEGEFFYDGCADAITCTAGCGAQSCTPNETQTPMREVELTLVVGSTRTSLGVKDADEQGRIVWDGVVPPGAPAGTATIEAEPRDRTEPVATLPLQVSAA
jgi:hypothetical protein